jgi:thioredoxin reductase (NADPH)
VLLATGISYRKLDVPRADALTGRGVFYGSAATEAPACSGEDVYIVGAANSAGQAAVYFSGYADRVTMLVRSTLEKSMSHYLITRIGEAPRIDVRTGSQAVAAEGEDGRLRRLRVRNADGAEEILDVDACFVFIGAQPHTDWLEGVVARDERGFILAGAEVQGDGWPLKREPYPLETSVPGIFVAGDVRARSIKRVASAVGEGSMAVSLIHQYLANA